MQILMPVINDNPGTVKLAGGFHNAKKVCIYDSEKKFYEWIPSDKINTSTEDFGNELKQRGIESIITGSMTPPVLKFFSQLGFHVFKADGDNLEKNIFLLLHQMLDTFTAGETRVQKNCNSTCHSHSCSTNCK